jgi:hypothetical protein
MATTKSTTQRKRQASRTAAPRNEGSSRAASARRDDSIVAQAGRTLKQRPYASAAIATGAVAALAGAFLFSRRDRSPQDASGRGASESLTHKVKGSFADARARIKDLIHSEDSKSQHEIAEEALTLKSTGSGKSAREDRSTNIKAGAIAY